MRTRCWRRWQAEKKFNRVFAVKESSYRLRAYYFAGSRYFPSQYERRIAVDQFTTVFIDSEEAFLEYKILQARKLRDNWQACSCIMCRNPRHSDDYRGQKKLTLQERKFLQSLHDWEF